MYWKLKSIMQNAIAALPTSASYAAYYWMQRRCGALRRVNPISRLAAGVETWKQIQAQAADPGDKVFLEIGAGRTPLVPLAYWLMGAGKTVTIDLNPYLKEELVRENLHYIATHPSEIRRIFGSLLDDSRLDRLSAMVAGPQFDLHRFFELCRIEYIAPADAAQTGFSPQSIDYHTSFTVFEHIPPEILSRILVEGNRIISPGGLFIHRIDYSDHFSHSDDRISAINFLQYSDDKWKRYAGNRYMYMNRLRHDDFINMFRAAGHCVLREQIETDPRSQELLQRKSIHLDERFRGKSEEVLAISGSWIVTKKAA